MASTQASGPSPTKSKSLKRKNSNMLRLLFGFSALLAGLGLIVLLAGVFTIAIAYPNLPAIDSLRDYRPKIPLRIFSAENVLIGEFGEERRTLEIGRASGRERVGQYV